MDRNAYTNQAKAWEYAEHRATAHSSEAALQARRVAEQAGAPADSAAQDAFLAMLVRLTGASSVIAVGTRSLVETMALVDGLDGAGHLTVVDSSAQGVDLVRKAFASRGDTATTLRAVHAQAADFLPRLNGEDYDLIVVAGDGASYRPVLDQAPRLLREHGALVMLDALAFAGKDAKGGVTNPADRSDKAVAMRALLDSLDEATDFETVLIPVGTGLLIARKR